jgi:hypothetical protein
VIYIVGNCSLIWYHTFPPFSVGMFSDGYSFTVLELTIKFSRHFFPPLPALPNNGQIYATMAMIRLLGETYLSSLFSTRIFLITQMRTGEKSMWNEVRRS